MRYVESKSKICYAGYIKGFEKLLEKGYLHKDTIPLWASREAIKIVNNITRNFKGHVSPKDAAKTVDTYCNEKNCFKRPVKFEEIVECMVNMQK